MALKAFGESPITELEVSEFVAVSRVCVFDDGVPVGYAIWAATAYAATDTAVAIRRRIEQDWATKFDIQYERADGDTATFVWLDGLHVPAEEE